jgi:hypothetical protein
MIALLTVLCLAVSLTVAHADCITLDLSAWTAEERGLVNHAAIQVLNAPLRAQPVGENAVEVCSDVSTVSLDAAALRTSIQTFLAARNAAESTRQANIASARTEVQTNALCRAPIATLEQRVDTEKAAIQADIDAIDATGTIGDTKLAMTTMLNRTMAALKFMLRCEYSRAVLQGEE